MNEWFAFSTLEPFGGDIDDLRDARKVTIQMSAVGQASTLESHLLGEKPPPKEQTVDDITNVLRGIADRHK